MFNIENATRKYAIFIDKKTHIIYILNDLKCTILFIQTVQQYNCKKYSNSDGNVPHKK